MSRPFRSLLSVVLALAALFGLATVVMNTPWFRRTLERRVIARLEDLTGARVEVQAFSFYPTIFQITLRRLTLHGTELPSEAPLFTAAAVRVRFSPLSLLRRGLRLRRLEWENAGIHIVTRADGSTNLPGPLASLKTKQAVDELLDLSMRRVVLTHTEIQWNNQRLPLDLEAQNVSLLLRLRGAHQYTGSLSFSMTRFQTPRRSWPSMTLASAFELSRIGVTVNSLTWQSSAFSGQCSLELRDLASPNGSFACQGRAAFPEFSRAFLIPQLRRGSFKWDAQGTFHQGEVKAQGHIRGREILFQSAMFSPGRIDLSTDYFADRHHVELKNFTISALRGNAQGAVEISYSPLNVIAHAQLRGMELAEALGALSHTQPAVSHLRLSARLDGTAEASWNSRPETLLSKFDLALSSPARLVSDSLPVTGRIRGQATAGHTFALELTEAELATPKSVISGQGKLSTLQSDLAFRVVTSDFEEWRPLVQYFSGASPPIPLRLESRVVVTGTVSGPTTRPEFRAQLQLGAFQYRGWEWDSFEGNILAGRRNLEIPSARLRRGQSLLTLNASAALEDWKLAPDSLLRVSIQAQHTPVEGLKAALGLDYPLGGSATGRLDLDGTPHNLTGKGTLRIEQGVLLQEPFDSLSTKLRINASVWNLDDIELKKGAGRMVGQMSLQPSQPFFRAEFRGSNFSVAQFRRLSLFGVSSREERGLEGRGSFDVRGEGTPENIQLHSKWNVQSIHLGGSEIGNLGGKLDWQGNQLRFEGKGEGPGGRVQFTGEVLAEANWPFSLSGTYKDFRADPWIHSLSKSKLTAVVNVNGSFTITGPLKDLRQLQARSQINELEIRFPSLTWKNERPVDLHYGAGVLTANRFRLRGPSTALDVEGSLRAGENPALFATAQGDAEATLLSLFDPAIQATGRSEVKLRVSGTPARPLINGTLDVQNVSLTYGNLPFRLAGLNGEIRLEGERATVRSLRGVSGGGYVTLSGYVTLGEMARFDVRADLDQVRVPYPTDFTSVLAGNLHLVGTPEHAQLGGELTVRQLLVSENFNLLTRLLEGANRIAGPLPGVNSPVAAKVRLNVLVNSAPLRLESREWSLAADLDLRLQGTVASPVELGIIELRSGEAVFRGNRYRLTRGEIRLANPYRTQPVLDLEATTRVQRYDLTVNISGPLDRLKLAYRSDPPLPTSDVLSLLALGFSREESEMSTSGTQAARSVGASALLSEALASQVTGRVQRLFGVSRVKFDPNVGGPLNASGARVTVEQQLTRDLTLTYVTNTATSQYRIIQFEWALSENTSLIGIRDQNGIFGVEIKFRHRFK